MTTYKQMCKNRADWDRAIQKAKKIITDRDPWDQPGVKPMFTEILVRIKYVHLDIGEDVYCVSGLMPISEARKLKDSNRYAQAVIVKDEEGWPAFDAQQEKANV